jgi:hypothetical protein
LIAIRDDPDPVLRQVVAGGQLSEGITLSEMGRSRDTAGAYRQLIDRHGGDPTFSVLVERAEACLRGLGNDAGG